MNDLISRKALIAEYDRVHVGPPGGARKLMEDAPTIEAIPIKWIEKYLEYLDNCENGFAQLAKLNIKEMENIWTTLVNSKS